MIVQATISLAAPTSEGTQAQFFTAVGAGISDRTAFRTQFELMNEQNQGVDGQLVFFSAGGSTFHPEISHSWVGEEGSIDLSGSRVSFLIRPNSSLVLTLMPGEPGGLGWSRLETNGLLGARAVLQVAELPPDTQFHPPSLEHYIEHLAEIEPIQGLKSVTFPIWLFEGLKRISTAFGVVNLAGVPGEVRLTFRSGSGQTALTKTVLLQPGELLADYFDRFWQLAFPEIFPFELRAFAEVESVVPLGLTVFRTLQDYPVSGVKAVEKPRAVNRVEVILDSEFELAVDESGIIEAENLRIDFWNVAGDSRCPVDVVCVWEGEAIIELNIFKSGLGPRRFRLSTRAEGNAVRFDQFLIKLLKVDPVPVSTEKTQISDYRVTLIVTKE
jgi:hypothetical protein